LLWWIKSAPLPVPILTVGNPADAEPGAIGQPGTMVLSGNSLNYGALPGFRVMVGGWFDPGGCFGAEVGGFYLGQGSQQKSTFSDLNGIPSLYVPVFRPDLGREGAFTLSGLFPGPDLVVGGLTQSSRSQLWGLEANGLLGLERSEYGTVELLAGVRYLNLLEGLTLQGVSNDQTFSDYLSFTDRFNTQNQFLGGQLGARGKLNLGPFDVAGTAKVALGATYRQVSIFGATLETGAGLSPGGVFTQPSNIGQQSHTGFSVVPQVGVQLGWNINRNVRLFAGYDFLYWSGVVRPGDQIDRNVNLLQTSMPAAPLPRFSTTGFWAQGVSCGLEIRF